MVVVVKDLVVITARPAMAPHEDLVGSVEHHLPDVVVGEQGLERAIAGQVPVRALRYHFAIGQVERTQAPIEVGRPERDLVVDDRPELREPLLVGHVERDLFRPELHPSFELLKRRQRHPPTACSLQLPSEPGLTRSGPASLDAGWTRSTTL